MISCAPGPRGVGKLPPPRDLKAVTVSHGAVVHWSVNRGKSSDIYGYNIYLSEKSLKSEFARWGKDHPRPHNYTPYPGDTDGDQTKESYEIKNLINGRSYFVSVRTVGRDGIESKPSNEIQFTPLARGTFVISSNHSSDNGGFGFDSELSMPARNPRCDIYLYAKGDEVGLSSPSRLGAGLRRTYFNIPGIINIREMDSIRIKKGDRINATGKYGTAELLIRKIGRHNLTATATIDYVFYPPDYHRE